MLNFFKNMFSQTKKSQDDGTPPPKKDDGTPPPKKDKSHPGDKSDVPPVKERVRKVSPSRGGKSEDDSERDPAITSNETSASADGMASFYARRAKKAKKRKSRTKDLTRRAPAAHVPIQKGDFEWKDPESFMPPDDTAASGPPAKNQRVGHVYVYKRGDPNFHCDNTIQCKNCNLPFGYLSVDEPDKIGCTECGYYCHTECMASSKICEYCYKMMN